MAMFNSKLFVYQRVNLHFPMVFPWFTRGYHPAIGDIHGYPWRQVGRIERLEAPTAQWPEIQAITGGKDMNRTSV